MRQFGLWVSTDGGESRDEALSLARKQPSFVQILYYQEEESFENLRLTFKSIWTALNKKYHQEKITIALQIVEILQEN